MIHEVPGLHPGVIAFGERLVAFACRIVTFARSTQDGSWDLLGLGRGLGHRLVH